MIIPPDEHTALRITGRERKQRSWINYSPELIGKMAHSSPSAALRLSKAATAGFRFANWPALQAVNRFGHPPGQLIEFDRRTPSVCSATSE